MRKAVCFVSIYIFVNTAEAVKPKSVNLALETVLQFDKKDHSADVEVLNRVQSFLDNIKNVMSYSKSGRKTNNARSDLKFTDFLVEIAEVLKNYDDDDLEDFFAVLDDQSRKYNYKGCKFYELVDNQDVRRFMSNKLEQAKDTSAKTMRSYLTDAIKVLRFGNYEEQDQGVVNLINSLYDGVSERFDNVVQNLRAYHERKKDTDMNLEGIVSTALRSLFFDHYSNLNDNARQQLKREINNYWQTYQGNGGNNKNTNFGVFKQRKDHKSKLRVIEVSKFINNDNLHKWGESYIKHDHQKVTPSSQQDALKSIKISSYTNKPPSQLDIDFIEFKKGTRDHKQDENKRTKAKETKKRYTKEFEYTKPLNDEVSYKSIEFEWLTTRENNLKFFKKDLDKKNDRYAATTKMSDEETVVKNKKSEIKETSFAEDSIDTTKGISIELSNAKYINKENKKHQGNKHAKKNTKHGTNNNNHIPKRKKLSMKAQRYSDNTSSDDYSVTDEDTDLSEKVKTPKKTAQVEQDDIGILVGGQNIHDMHYRAEHKSKNIPIKPHKVPDNYKHTEKKAHINYEKVPNQKLKEILTDYNAVFKVQLSTRKLRERAIEQGSIKNRQKNYHKSSNKSKERKKARHFLSEADEEVTKKASYGKPRKQLSAFSISNEGISIASFENENGNRYSIIRKANIPMNGNNNVSTLIHNLEKQLEDVKEQIKMVKAIGININNETETNVTIQVANDENDKQVRTNENNLAEITTTKRGKTSTDRNDTEKEAKQDTTTTKTKVTKDITSKNTPKATTTSTTVVLPIFRSHDDGNDNIKSQKSIEKGRPNTTTADKDVTTTKANVSNNIKTSNNKLDLKFDKTIENKSIASIANEDNKHETKTLDKEIKLTEMSKNKTASKNDVRQKFIEETVKYKKSNIFDLTNQLNESDTVILNVGDDTGTNKTKPKDGTTKNIDKLGLPKEDMRNNNDKLGLPKLIDLQDDRLDDPFNDLDVNLDFMTP